MNALDDAASTAARVPLRLRPVGHLRARLSGLVGLRTSGSLIRWDWDLALVPLCVACIGYTAWYVLVPLHVGPVRLEVIDIGLAIAVLASAFVWAAHGLADRTRPTWWLAVGLVCLLLMPVFLGLAAGHDWESVLRPARVAACYSLVALAPQLVRDRRAAERLCLVIVGLVCCAAAFAFISMAFGLRWQSGLALVPTLQGVVSRGYGMPSAMPWYPLGAILCAAFCLFSPSARRLRWVSALLCVILSVLTLLTLVRTSYIALIAGLALVIGLRAAQRRPSGDHMMRLLRVHRRAVLLGGLAVVVCFGGLLAARPGSVRLIVERAVSVVDPSASSAGAAHNRELRILAIRAAGASALRNPVGIGYGYGGNGANVRTLAEESVGYFAGHSGLSWAGFYLGVVGTVVLLTLGFSLVVRTAQGCGRRQRRWWVAVGVASCGVALVLQSLGASLLFSSPETFPLVPVFIALALLACRLDTPLPSGRAPAGSGLSPVERASSPGNDHAERGRHLRTRVSSAWTAACRSERHVLAVGAVSAIGLVLVSAAVLLAVMAGRAWVWGDVAYGHHNALTVAPWSALTSSSARRQWSSGVRQQRPFPVWYMPTNGYVVTYVRLGRSVQSVVTVQAWGTPAAGGYPEILLRVDGEESGPSQTVGWYPYDYRWRVQLREGLHELRVDFTNDAVSGTQDRNLFIASMIITPSGTGLAPQLATRKAWIRRAGGGQ